MATIHLESTDDVAQFIVPSPDASAVPEWVLVEACVEQNDNGTRVTVHPFVRESVEINFATEESQLLIHQGDNGWVYIRHQSGRELIVIKPDGYVELM